MASFVSFVHATYFILAQVSLLIVINGEFSIENTNNTEHDSSLNSGRLKRAPTDGSPRELKIRIKYVTGEEIDLQFVMVTQYVANEYLRVVTPFGYSGEDVMKAVGQFVIYHDISNCAAVVHFKNTEALYGVVGMDYHITSLPFDFDESGVFRSGVVGEPFVRKIVRSSDHIFPDNVIPPPSDMNALVDFFSPTVPDSISIQSQLSDHDLGPETRRSRMRRNFSNRTVNGEMNGFKVATTRNRRDNELYRNYYLETLVFVTQDIVEHFKNFYQGHDYIDWIVRHQIVYFSSVDMMLQTLRSHLGEIRINIAKIIIEDSLDPFDFTMGDGDLQFADIVDKVPRYLHENRDYNPPDSFDYVFIYTRRQIMDYTVSVNGLTKHGSYLYEARQHHRFYDVVPISVVKFQSRLADYVVAIHEIGRILNLKIDGKCDGLTPTGQCQGIMQREGPKCCNCFKWSSQSYKNFQLFLRTNRNRCFLLNKPRSLQPFRPTSLVSIKEQCHCFGYLVPTSNWHECRAIVVGNHFCKNPLPCVQLDGSHYIHKSTVRPFDGTSCNAHKVCWNGECV